MEIRRRKNTTPSPDVPTSSKRSSHVVFVHGTFASGSETGKGYAAPGSDMAKLLQEQHGNASYSAFGWSGDATESARNKAGKQLAKQLSAFGPNDDVHLVGHSHGGNVIGHALQRLPEGQSVGSVTMLGTPHWSSGQNPSWNPESAKRVKGNITTAFSTRDNVQTSGAMAANLKDSGAPTSYQAHRTLSPTALESKRISHANLTPFGHGVDHHSSLHDTDVLAQYYKKTN